VDCTGAADSTAGINTALTAAVGKTLFIPSGCRLGLGSPTAGAGNGAVNIPAGSKIRCEDSSAGFFAVGLRCTDGTYVGAACTTASGSSTECPGGTTCAYNFGSSTFAPTGGSTYTMLHDTGN
jgi:hypothetical protein